MKYFRNYAHKELYKTADFSYDILAEAVEIENFVNQRKLNKFTLQNVKVIRNSQNEFYYRCKNDVVLPNVFDKLLIIPNLPNGHMSNSESGMGRIKSIKSGIIHFTSDDQFDRSKLYTIKCEFDRSLTDTCLQAIENLKLYQLEKYFLAFKDQTVDKKMRRNIKAPTKWFNASFAKDPKQKEAVEKIITESAFPFPFVVGGGPGTGKTSVLVEAVTQILEKSSQAKILITCQSNSACDEVGIRLRNFLPAEFVFRYFSKAKARSKSSNKDNYFEKLRENSTINKRRMFVPPSKEELLKFKIVIATMTVTNRFINDGVPKDHFDFIFIDECCAATEPECLIPIVGLGMDYNKVNANIILIGDAKLLGPVVNSSQARELGLGKKFTIISTYFSNI